MLQRRCSHHFALANIEATWPTSSLPERMSWLLATASGTGRSSKTKMSMAQGLGTGRSSETKGAFLIRSLSSLVDPCCCRAKALMLNGTRTALVRVVWSCARLGACMSPTAALTWTWHLPPTANALKQCRHTWSGSSPNLAARSKTTASRAADTARSFQKDLTMALPRTLPADQTSSSGCHLINGCLLARLSSFASGEID